MEGMDRAMLIGIWGFHSTGKTYFTQSYMNLLADCSAHPLVVVNADVESEYHLEGHVWMLDRVSKKWKGSKAVKQSPAALIADRDKLWIVESGRYFSGLGPTMAEAIRVNGGGMRYVVPQVDSQLAKLFLMGRKRKLGKPWTQELEEYWTPDKLSYEGARWQLNLHSKYLEPLGVPLLTFQLSESRAEWVTQALPVLKQWVADKDWYTCS